ncbi:MAG: GrpB family protein [Planctomycetes bacterium]|nr:GrpB family protein [Planctomycetota bacterium]
MPETAAHTRGGFHLYARSMADPVVIVDYDPAWPGLYAREAESLLRSFGDAEHAIEHIGSTAVPGLAAKPVIDILVAVAEPALLDASAEEQAVTGEEKAIDPRGNDAHVGFVRGIVGCKFTYRGVNGLPGRLYFFRHREGRSAHVHVARRDSWFVQDQLLFRDWLRSHPHDVLAYQTLKRELAERLRDDRIAYTNAKRDFIRDILLQAGGVGPWLHES